MHKVFAWLLAGLWALLAALPAGAQGAEEARAIVAFKPSAELVRRRALAADRATQAAQLQQRADALAVRAGLPLRSGRAVHARAQVVRARGIDAATLAARLARHPDVAWAVVDQRRRALRVPNDPLYGPAVRPRGPDAGQWYLRGPDATLRSASNAQAAWDRVTGSAAIVVAVLDTGVRADHPDLAGALLPGIDMISDVAAANDGDGVDADPSDPGDWITPDEDAAGPFQGCGVAASSWHGTQVASLVGATADDGIGMAGTAFGVRILPVRVLGKCGGYDSDIVAGMYWAGGLQAVEGRANPNPARVVNLSLGSAGVCTEAYREAIAALNAAGTTVVVAAGNSTGRAVGTPANCAGAIAVAGLRHAGTKVGFSDLGPEITIAAPGGNCVHIDGVNPCLYPILAASNSGPRGPHAGGSVWTDSFDISVGTSFATPIVAGTVALMLSARPALTAAEVRAALQAGARPFPTSGADNGPSDPTPVPVCRAPDTSDQLQCYCAVGLCGAGMLDAAGAVAAATGLLARIEVVGAAPTAGVGVVLDGGASQAGPGRHVVGYQWTLIDGGGIVSAFASAIDASTATLQPATAAGVVVVRLTATDDLGARASVEQRIVIAAAPPPPPSPPPATGGGALGWPWLAALAVAVLVLRGRARTRHPGPDRTAYAARSAGPVPLRGRGAARRRRS